MNPPPSSAYLSSSRRRFVTFGATLIMAACLTLIKMTMIALEVKERDLIVGTVLPNLPQSTDAPTQPLVLDESQFVPWPTSLPEPAAGPGDQIDGPASPFDDPPPLGVEPGAGDQALALDPSTLTDGQIQALQQLAVRRQQLDERERLLDMRAELNGGTEARLDQQIDRLAALKQRIEALITNLDENEERKLARLVKIYETMKPKAAAEIFNRLDISVLLHVVERMKEAKSAVVLGKMDPVVAKRVTTELARRKERPSLDGSELDG